MKRRLVFRNQKTLPYYKVHAEVENQETIKKSGMAMKDV